MRKLNKLDWQEKDRLNGLAHWKVRARLAVLKNDYRSAEHLLLAQGQVDEAIEMYQHLHKWEDAIRVAEAKNHAGCEQMKRSYYDYLVESRQEEKAAAVKVKDGDYASAVSLYLKGGLPAKAAQLLNQRNLGRDHKQLLETVADALYSAGMFEKAGDQFEKMEQESRALAAFIKANAFRKAVESHESTFQTRTTSPFHTIGDSARHYQDAGNLEQAERCFITDAARDAVEMYTRANKWDAAYQVALNHLDKYETERLYVEQAHRMECWQAEGGEKLFLTVNEPDLAINMYKNHKNYEQMIRLVTKYRKDLLKDTHLYLAQQLEHEGNYKEAEHHFAEA
ncbi:intraflagellar transport protein 172, partial [Phytophthora cinnamomi]|uniref:intraflagellar transport protein 172 n=1 Tax=Phytophthora cinnamomi TaxID=4785 RepID=UPI003559A471